MQHGDTTQVIFSRARDGDRRAAETLLARAAPAVRRWARGRLPKFVRATANTEDLVQDAVLLTLKSIPRFRLETVAGLHAYLRTIVMNRMRDLIRRSKVQGVRVDLHPDLADEQVSPIEAAIRQERLETFLSALQRLKPSDRQVLVWRIRLGYTVEDIAVRLGKSKAAAGMTITRAIDRLMNELDTRRHS